MHKVLLFHKLLSPCSLVVFDEVFVPVYLAPRIVLTQGSSLELATVTSQQIVHAVLRLQGHVWSLTYVVLNSIG